MENVHGASVGHNYRFIDSGKVVRVLYIAQHNDTEEPLVAYCHFNYIERECVSSDTTDSVKMMPISQWRKFVRREDK